MSTIEYTMTPDPMTFTEALRVINISCYKMSGSYAGMFGMIEGRFSHGLLSRITL